MDERRPAKCSSILAAIGCIPPERIGEAAHHIYRTGIYQDVSAIRVRLVAIGRERNNEVAASYPEATQVLWTDLLTFMWDRFRTYRQQKTQVEQWDTGGRRIKSLADKSHDSAEFVDCALRLMGVRSQHGID